MNPARNREKSSKHQTSYATATVLHVRQHRIFCDKCTVLINTLCVWLSILFLSDCNTSFFVDMLETNNLPLCYNEAKAVMEYLAGLSNDEETAGISRADLLGLFRVMAGNKYTSGRNYEGYLCILRILLWPSTVLFYYANNRNEKDENNLSFT